MKAAKASTAMAVDDDDALVNNALDGNPPPATIRSKGSRVNYLTAPRAPRAANATAKGKDAKAKGKTKATQLKEKGKGDPHLF